jgi:transcription initiation factor TFIIIB Brf1 subunit/transcription initiation factor TFIIB
MVCYFCHLSNVTSVGFETICIDCGTVQESDFIDREAITVEHNEFFCGDKRNVVDEFCDVFGFPTSVCLTAKELFQGICEEKIFKGVRRESIGIACVYASQVVMNGGKRYLREFPCDEHLMKSVTLVEQFIHRKPQWKFLIKAQSVPQFDDHLNLIVGAMDVSLRSKIRKTAQAVMMSVQCKLDDNSLVGIQENSIYSSIIFIALKQVNPGYQKKKFCEISKVSTTTLTKVTHVLNKLGA